MALSSISCIVLDLDGTLLNSNKEVSQRNYHAIMECYKSGYEIIFATARPPRTVKCFLPEDLLSLGYFVYYNGAFIINDSKSLNDYVSIDAKVLSKIIEYCTYQSPTCTIGVEYKDECFCYQEIDYSNVTKVKGDSKIIDMEELKKLDATKILLTEFEEVQSLINKFGDQVNILTTDGGHLIQIMPKGASKALAITKICEMEGIGLENILVLGDDFNDLGLFQICGYSVAMGNAIQELKDIANEVTESNDNDGVAIILERIVRLFYKESSLVKGVVP